MTDELQKEFVIFANWKTYRPDMRQYRQNSVELELVQEVAAVVPNLPDYIYRVVEGVPTLTAKGLKYVQDQFDNVYGVELPENTKEFIENEGFETKNNVETIDNWGDDEPEDKKEKVEENVPDTETWNEKEEDWQ